MIPMAGNNFSTPIPTLMRENHHILANKMKVYLKGLSLWEVVENDVDFVALSSNPTLMRLKKYEEDLAKKPKTLTYIHSVISDAVLARIMICESPKEP